MANTRMTQTQLVKSLAESNEVSNKQMKEILEKLASTAIAEVKKNSVFVLPGIGQDWCAWIVKPARDATRRPAKPSRFPPRKL